MKFIDFSTVSKMLAYDETSPSCLRWICAPNKVVKPGDVAGYIKTDGYWAVKVKGKLYPAHRIVMALHGKSVNGSYVDHISRDKSDNRMCNLRLATISQNNSNKTLKIREEIVRGFKYFSVLQPASKSVKRFSVYKYGEEKARELANAFIQAQQAQIDSILTRLAALEAK